VPPERQGHAGRADGERAGGVAVPYVPVGSFFVHRRLRPGQVWRLLWEQQLEFLGSEGKTLRRGGALIERLPPWFVRGWRATTGTGRFVRARVVGGRRLLTLPVEGEIAIERRSGAVKVIQRDRGRVVTVMPGDRFASKLRERVDLARSVQRYPFAPRVEEVALEEGWFAEEFIQGQHPTAFRGCRDGFEQVYLPLLVAFLRAEPPRWRALGDYAAELADEILAGDGLLARLPDAPREDVATFVTDLRRRLTAASTAAEPLPLVLSHGDYFSGNLVIPADGPPRAIDWAHVGWRSPLHDLYYVMMNHCVKVLAERSRRERIEQVVAGLRSRLAAEDPARLAELERGLALRDELRWLFYLECVQVPLRSCDDPDDRYVRAMVNRVGWFRAYEDAIGSMG